MVNVTYLNAFKGTAPRPGIMLRAFRGITIHDTGNPSATADAQAHADLLRGSWQTRDTSWHYAVDDHSIFQSIPEDEVSWHAGDGSSGVGNNETISIETCVNEGGDYQKTMALTADLCADILLRRGIKDATSRMFQHFEWTGKNCPAYIRANGLWPVLLTMVQNRINEAGGPIMANTHTIVRGDTLWALSRIYGVTVETIKAANPGLDPNSLTIGSVINIPTAKPETDVRIAELENQLVTAKLHIEELNAALTESNKKTAIVLGINADLTSRLNDIKAICP